MPAPRLQLRILVAAAALLAALPPALGEAWVADQFYSDELTTTLPLSRGQPKFVGRTCMFVGPRGGSPSAPDAAVYAPQLCRLFWTFLWDEAGGSGVQISVYGDPRPKAGAAPLDSWTTSWNRDWNRGGGVPADKTYAVNAASDPAIFRTLDAPYFVFASMASGSEQQSPVSMWFASFVLYATTVTRTPGGWLDGAAPGSSSDFVLRACNVDGFYMYSLDPDGRACSRIQGEVRIDPVNPLYSGPANVIFRVRLFDVSQTAPFSFAFGQSLPGGPAAENASVAVLYRSDSPALFVDLESWTPPLTPTCGAASPNTPRARTRCLGRFGGGSASASGGLSVVAIAFIVVGVALCLAVVVGVGVYCVRPV
eukprot:tig00020601_g11715.t1